MIAISQRDIIPILPRGVVTSAEDPSRAPRPIVGAPRTKVATSSSAIAFARASGVFALGRSRVAGEEEAGVTPES